MRVLLALLLVVVLVGCGSAAPAQEAGAVDAGVTDAPAAGDAASDPFAPTVVPTSEGDRLVLAFGSTVFEVERGDGARIVGFSRDGANVLVTDGAYVGSTFWPAPQSAWPGGWPPPPELDTATFTGGIEGTAIVLHGLAASADFHALRADKRFTANAEHEVVTVEYTLHNDGASAVRVAPWEVTRVHPGGLSFFPDRGAPLVAFPDPAVPLTRAADARWFEYRAAAITGSRKSGADGAEGWVAHVDCHASLERACAGPSLLLVKSFGDTDAADVAPGEAEVELYADGAHGYVELEDQGSEAEIPAGGARTWVVHWYLRELPPLTTLTGNPALLDFVRAQL